MLYKKELQKTNQTEFRVDKVTEQKSDKLYCKWKSYDNSFKNWMGKKIYPYVKWVIVQNNILAVKKIRLIRFFKLCNKIWFKKATAVDISLFTEISDLASLKSDVDELDIDKFITVLVDLSNVSKAYTSY